MSGYDALQVMKEAASGWVGENNEYSSDYRKVTNLGKNVELALACDEKNKGGGCLGGCSKFSYCNKLARVDDSVSNLPEGQEAISLDALQAYRDSRPEKDEEGRGE
ncbi:hypothetical protein FWH58_01795 [Candidatus Saccharibacteria bacterium]|nr:hypothetical protein [Candidatus Saccharibacteria bacterium]